ncbi:heme exporter protein CcmB [bacterium]|nr:heme exporter protein CcmB [bacterium]
MEFLKKIWALFDKDFLTERRTKEFFSAMCLFAIMVLVVFNFTIDPELEQTLSVGPGILWVAFTFAGTLGLNRAFAPESENGNFQALRLLPIDKGAIYLGKMLSAFVFMFFTELVILPLFIVFFNLRLSTEIPALLLTCAMGTFGFVAAGTIFSAISLNTKMREVILPLLLFPVAVPLLIASVECTAVILRGDPFSDTFDWLKIMGAFDIIIVIGSFLTFEYVLEE